MTVSFWQVVVLKVLMYDSVLLAGEVMVLTVLVYDSVLLAGHGVDSLSVNGSALLSGGGVDSLSVRHCTSGGSRCQQS